MSDSRDAELVATDPRVRSRLWLSNPLREVQQGPLFASVNRKCKVEIDMVYDPTHIDEGIDQELDPE